MEVAQANDGEKKMKVTPCQLPYPEKFELALSFYKEGRSSALTNETNLILYGLSQQVTFGPCTEKKPWAWNAVEQAKWQAWSHLDKMDKMEAMRLFVKTLEEEEPNWYGIMQADAEEAEPSASPEASVASALTLSSMPVDGLWKTPWVTADKHPHPRYEHSACVLGNCMYVLGGNCAGGRYLSDLWQLHLDTLTWTCTTASYKSAASGDDAHDPSAVMPPCAGMVSLPHRGRVLVIGGHTKDKNPNVPMVVRVLDPVRSAWSVLPCDGDIPKTRGGHAACIVADKVYVIGGEDPMRSLVAGVHVLDLTTNTWSELPPDTTGDVHGECPSPRSALVCAAYQDRYMLVFGGGSAAHCHNDFWVFDTDSGEWSRPVTAGQLPQARAGCAAAVLGNTFYVVGGGNNVMGCPDMWTMDLTALGVSSLRWELACEFERHNALATEGASLCASAAHGALVAFGGYNGTYHNAISIFKPHAAPSGAPLPPVYTLDSAAIHIHREPEITPATPRGAPNNGLTDKQVQAAASAAMEDALAMKDAVNQELSLMRHQLAGAQAAKEAAEQEARDAAAELAAERETSSKLRAAVLKLEVEVTELQGTLQALAEVEAEVAKYKMMLSEKDKSKTGIWGFISGA